MTTRWYNPDNPRYTGEHDGRYWFPDKRTAPVNVTLSIPEKVEKNDDTFVDYIIMLPAHNFIIGSSIFGQVPVLWARAAARPAGGHIENHLPFYEAVLIR